MLTTISISTFVTTSTLLLFNLFLTLSFFEPRDWVFTLLAFYVVTATFVFCLPFHTPRSYIHQVTTSHTIFVYTPSHNFTHHLRIYTKSQLHTPSSNIHQVTTSQTIFVYRSSDNFRWQNTSEGFLFAIKSTGIAYSSLHIYRRKN